ncbi:DUF167 domain-containing protein [Patescibacteria group bacterium]|nr:DUF167 domain-containing protein [Patescibacteria group bacterium]MBU0880378.1 DUF167 domain-containing protein [Patescibacteria group bacterium]MBU0897607.1 DUF167 domain-containing protein [Patescibacteria group bacterium]MBU1991482.1 DUF167 domain-containing protein [Patescibacteria group bacterium]MBU2081385.1 DUF167 domain-containing protein [Patescibacteria group bacterium]
MNIDYLVKFKKILLDKGEVYLRIKVHPNAIKTCIKEIMADKTIKIDLAVAPIKGKANIELIKFLAQQFDTNVSNIKIISGITDRMKLIKIACKNF